MAGKNHHRKFQGISFNTPFFLPCVHWRKDMGRTGL